MRNHFISTCILCTAIIFLSGCLGPKKINKWVAQNYSEVPSPSKKKNDIVTVTSSVTVMNNLSETQKKTSNVLPLIFYWQYDYKNICMLNPQIAVNNFINTVMAYSNKTLKQKLNGKRVELNIQKIPNSFAVDDKGRIVWVIVYAFSWEKLTVVPQDKDLVVNYTVFNSDNSVYKSGTESISNADKGISLGMFQSLKKKTFQYLDQYDESITAMSKKCIDQVALDL